MSGGNLTVLKVISMFFCFLPDDFHVEFSGQMSSTSQTIFCVTFFRIVVFCFSRTKLYSNNHNNINNNPCNVRC